MSGDPPRRLGKLAGVRVATTREHPGLLDELLREAGAAVVHVPLISVDVNGDRAEFVRLVGELRPGDWVVVTSQHGARWVADELADRGDLRVAAVGTATARVIGELVGRQPDLVPDRQTGAGLVAALASHSPGRVVVAQADIAADTVQHGLAELGFDVATVTAYSTRARTPTAPELAALASVDAVAFASGSAVTAWADAVGVAPPIVAAIGPTTAEVAAARGISVTVIAREPTLYSLRDALIDAHAGTRSGTRGDTHTVSNGDHVD